MWLIFTLKYTIFTLNQSANHEFQTLPHPATFLTVCVRRSKDGESFHPCSHAKISWTHHTTSFCWLASETKRWNLGLNLRPPPLNKTGNLPPCHLTTPLPLNKTGNLPPCHLTTLPSFPNSHRTTFPSLRLCHLTILAAFPPYHLTPLINLSHLLSSLLSDVSQLTFLSTTNKPLQNSNVLPLGRQGKHVWLIIRQPFMKIDWWDEINHGR